MNPVENRSQISSRAAAGIKYANIRRGEPQGLTEFRAKEMVDTFDHVVDDLLRGVPDAKGLSELGIERLQKRLVEVGDGLLLREDAEKCCTVDAVQRLSCQIQD